MHFIFLCVLFKGAQPPKPFFNEKPKQRPPLLTTFFLFKHIIPHAEKNRYVIFAKEIYLISIRYVCPSLMAKIQAILARFLIFMEWNDLTLPLYFPPNTMILFLRTGIEIFGIAPPKSTHLPSNCMGELRTHPLGV